MALRFEPLDQNRFIKENDLKEVTNPITFAGGGRPTPDGLLSQEIFGITQEERSGIFGYIDLHENFIQPFFYKIWLKIDRNLRACIYETQNFIIDKDGYLVPDDNGNTGIKWLHDNISKIKFKNTKKDNLLTALMQGKNNGQLFTDKIIVIPPYYRDVNTSGGAGKVSMGEVNKLYIALLNSVRALNESSMYGFDTSGGTRGRIQDILCNIYDWFTSGKSPNGTMNEASGIARKFGVLRRSVISKTADNSARLVISAPKINVNSTKDLMVNMDYSAIPLSAALVVAYPFILHELRNFFQNEFGGKTRYPAVVNGKITTVELNNPLLEFSDDRLDAEMNEFIHGYSNRLKPIKVPTDELDLNIGFKGYNVTPEQYEKGIRETGNVVERAMTWVDVFYIAACAATEDKIAIISRYPIDSYFNQLYTRMHISSTIKTQPMIVNGKFYPWYPSFEQKDIGSNTSNKFIDTLSLSNPYCVLMNAD